MAGAEIPHSRAPSPRKSCFTEWHRRCYILPSARTSMTTESAATPSTGNQPSPPKRRDMLSWLLGTRATGVMGAIVYPGDALPRAAGRFPEAATHRPAPARRRRSRPTPARRALRRQPAHRHPHRRPASCAPSPPSARTCRAPCSTAPDLEHIWCACHNGHYDLNGTQRLRSAAAAARRLRRERRRATNRHLAQAPDAGHDRAGSTSACRSPASRRAHPAQDGAAAPPLALVLLRRHDAVPLRRPGGHRHPAAALLPAERRARPTRASSSS